jgi:uncharacterized protein YijF (DUF1287 family)
MLRREFLSGAITALALAGNCPARDAGIRLAKAAVTQLGVTTAYDPNYTKIAYPEGDVSRTTGVCADVVIRAARDGLALDLQRLVHEDMAGDFSAYPSTWGARHTDTNIDHRRVLNLEIYWRRSGASVWTATGETAGDAFPRPIQTGDLLTWLLDGRLPHVGIVYATGPLGAQVIHNIGGGVQQNYLAGFQPHQAKGHFRWPVS